MNLMLPLLLINGVFASGDTDKKYAALMNCGSGSTLMSVYELKTDDDEKTIIPEALANFKGLDTKNMDETKYGDNLELPKELHVLVTKEAYAQELDTNVKNYFQGLVDKTCEFLDKDNIKLADTVTEIKLHMYGTAGMRMLTEENKKKLLESISKAFEGGMACAKSDNIKVERTFKLQTDKENIILSGVQEGIYGWLSVNAGSGKKLDLDKLKKSIEEKTTEGVLDMGGESIQFAYQVDSEEEQTKNVGTIFDVKAGDLSVRLSSRSWMGYGQRGFVRKSVMEETESERMIKLFIPNPCLLAIAADPMDEEFPVNLEAGLSVELADKTFHKVMGSATVNGGKEGCTNFVHEKLEKYYEIAQGVGNKITPNTLFQATPKTEVTTTINMIGSFKFLIEKEGEIGLEYFDEALDYFFNLSANKWIPRKALKEQHRVKTYDEADELFSFSNWKYISNKEYEFVANMKTAGVPMKGLKENDKVMCYRSSTDVDALNGYKSYACKLVKENKTGENKGWTVVWDDGKTSETTGHPADDFKDTKDLKITMDESLQNRISRDGVVLASLKDFLTKLKLDKAKFQKPTNKELDWAIGALFIDANEGSLTLIKDNSESANDKEESSKKSNALALGLGLGLGLGIPILALILYFIFRKKKGKKEDASNQA